MRKIWEAVDHRGKRVVTDWSLPSQEAAAKLDQKIDMLQNAEVDPKTGKAGLPPELLAGPNIYGQKWIYKLKVRGKVQLRPMLCLGPIDRMTEWTILARATEKGNTLDPLDAADIAESRRQDIVNETNIARRDTAKRTVYQDVK